MLCKRTRDGLGWVSGLAALSLLLGLAGCGSASWQSTTSTQPGAPNAITANSPTTRRDRPLVIATNTILCDLTRQIAADTINLKCLVDAGSDPHEYKPTPEDRKAIEQAKLILYGGYNFEPELIRLINASSNPAPKIAVDEAAVPRPQQFQEDGQTEIDPHVFQSAANGIQMAVAIRQSLSQLEPGQASFYGTNTKKIEAELSQIHAWIKDQIATIPMAQRKLVTTHNAFGYYAKAYSIPDVGALQGINTEERPTPTRVKTLVEAIKSTAVPTIFAEMTINPTLIATVAKEAGVKVADQDLFADGLGEKGTPADTYQHLLITNTRTIVVNLGGTFTPFQPK